MLVLSRKPGERLVVPHCNLVLTILATKFEQADDGGGGAHQFSQRALTQAGLGAQLVDFSGYLVIGPGFLQGSDPVRRAFVIAAMDTRSSRTATLTHHPQIPCRSKQIATTDRSLVARSGKGGPGKPQR